MKTLRLTSFFSQNYFQRKKNPLIFVSFLVSLLCCIISEKSVFSGDPLLIHKHSNPKLLSVPSFSKGKNAFVPVIDKMPGLASVLKKEASSQSASLLTKMGSENSKQVSVSDTNLLFPILKKDSENFQEAKSVLDADQNALTKQQGIVKKDKDLLTTAQTKENSLEASLSSGIQSIEIDDQRDASLSTELTRSNEILNRAKASVQKEIATVQDLTAQKRTLESSIASSTKTLKTTQQEISTLKAKIAQLSTTISQEKETHFAPSESLSSLNSQLQAKNALIARTKQQISQDKTNLKKLAPYVKAAKAQKNLTSQTLTKLQGSLQTDEAAVLAAEKDLHTKDARLPAVQALAKSFATQASEANLALQKAQASSVLTADENELAANVNRLNKYGIPEADYEFFPYDKLPARTSPYYADTYNYDTNPSSWGNWHYKEAPPELIREDASLKITIDQLKKKLSNSKEAQSATASYESTSQKAQEAEALLVSLRTVTTDKSLISSAQSQLSKETAALAGLTQTQASFQANETIEDRALLSEQDASRTLTKEITQQEDFQPTTKAEIGQQSLATLNQDLQNKTALISTTTTDLSEDMKTLKGLESQLPTIEGDESKESQDIKNFQSTLTSDQKNFYTAEGLIRKADSQLAVDQGQENTYFSQKTLADETFKKAQENLKALQAQSKMLSATLSTDQRIVSLNTQKIAADGGGREELYYRDLMEAIQSKNTNPWARMAVEFWIRQYPSLLRVGRAQQALINEDTSLQRNMNPLQRSYQALQEQVTQAQRKLKVAQGSFYKDVTSFHTEETAISSLRKQALMEQAQANIDQQEISREEGAILSSRTDLKQDSISLATLKGKISVDQLNEQQESSDLVSDKASQTMLKEDFSQGEQKLSQNKSALSQEQQNLEGLQRNAQKQDSFITAQSNQLSSLTNALDTANNSLKKSQSDLALQAQNVSDTQTALTKAEQSLTTVQNTKGTTAENLQDLQAQVQTLSENLQSNQAQLTVLQEKAQKDSETITTLQTQQTSIESAIQKQVSTYNALVAQATKAKQTWINSGSSAALNTYNSLVQQIQGTNAYLQDLGGAQLPNLPLLKAEQKDPPIFAPEDVSSSSFPSSIPATSDGSPILSEEEDTFEEDAEASSDKDKESSENLEEKGDEKDDTRAAQSQDLSGGSGIMPTPGLAGLIGAEAVTDNTTEAQ